MILYIDRYVTDSSSYSVEYMVTVNGPSIANYDAGGRWSGERYAPENCHIDWLITNLVSLKFAVLHMKDSYVKNNDMVNRVWTARMKWRKDCRLIENGRRLFPPDYKGELETSGGDYNKISGRFFMWNNVGLYKYKKFREAQENEQRRNLRS